MPLASSGLACVWTEVSAKGWITREIGFDLNENVVYFFPNQFERRREYRRGIFDVSSVAMDEPSDVNAEEFDLRWRHALASGSPDK